MKSSILPYMNAKIDAGEAAFILHAGDFIGKIFVALPCSELHSVVVMC